jgi:hypothetical protein
MEQEYEYGYVYVFAVAGLSRVKVGFTNTTPQARLAQLNAPNGGAGSHRLEYVASWLCREPSKAEAKTHARLSEFRSTDAIGTEFFDLEAIGVTTVTTFCVIAHDPSAKPFGLARLEVRALIKGERRVTDIPEPERTKVKLWLEAFSARRSAAWARACAIVDAAIPPAKRPGAVEAAALAQPIFRSLFPELRLIEELESEVAPNRTSGLSRIYEVFQANRDACLGDPMSCAEAFFRALGEKDARELDEVQLLPLVEKFIAMRRTFLPSSK